ncbi:hypothetical protein [Bartonella tamiae]|uniref:Uncharacterized protein n=1 Tax=Bartonella tamiae Th239 TaxID=1094558 RepID=J1JVY2_9HYPH|nr:hypothetical protein [Bartonella tamiae]EJF89147.1 hypothetical protein ME5_01698 [Bartonella tamiae Th239]EJF95450.1 hypothetical protein MEG_00183 [Bartonella tamiae Th307]
MTIETKIYELAKKFNVTAYVTELDKLADKYSELSDAEVEFSVTEQLILNLCREGYITGDEMRDYHLQYLKESRNAEVANGV